MEKSASLFPWSGQISSRDLLIFFDLIYFFSSRLAVWALVL